MNNKMNIGRRRASVIMLITFIILIPSGIMMHLNDSPGFNDSRHHAMMLHNLCALIFVTAGGFHIKYNFNLIKKYFTDILSGYTQKNIFRNDSNT